MYNSSQFLKLIYLLILQRSPRIDKLPFLIRIIDQFRLKFRHFYIKFLRLFMRRMNPIPRRINILRILQTHLTLLLKILSPILLISAIRNLHFHSPSIIIHFTIQLLLLHLRYILNIRYHSLNLSNTRFFFPSPRSRIHNLRIMNTFRSPYTENHFFIHFLLNNVLPNSILNQIANFIPFQSRPMFFF